MRPYLAVIHDSFRFALSSRVLLVMLVLITVFLLVTAPAGYQEQLTTEILRSEILNSDELAKRLASGAELNENAPLRRIWDRLSPSLRERVSKYSIALQAEKDDEDSGKMPQPPSAGSFVADLNKVLADREFYSEDAWNRMHLLPEARNLIDKGIDSLSDEQVRRLNRLLLESTLSGMIQRGPPTSIRIVYGPVETGWVIRMRIEAIREIISTQLPWFIDTFLLSIGLLIATLVTAPLIPQTFEPGSLSLQLSKPISRSLLFLSKFVGGCAFTFLCATYLFIGVLLLLGIRWGIWEPKFLWCIPIYVFVFAIYYTVSAFAGLIWRNTIVSVIVVMGFWLMCFLTGKTKTIWEGVLDVQRLKQLTVVDNDILAVDEMNVPRRWDKSSREWKEALLSESEERQVSFGMFGRPFAELLGPVADPANDRVVLVKTTWGGRGNQSDVGVASAADNFKLRNIAEAPSGTILVAPEERGTILVVSSDGNFYRAVVPKLDLAADQLGEEAKQQTVKICGPMERVPFNRPLAAAKNLDRSVLALYSRGTIHLFKADDEGTYKLVATKKLRIPEDEAASLAFAGNALLVAQSNGKLHLLDGTTLQERKTFSPESSTGPRHVRAAPGGACFAVAYHSGNLWLIDAKSGEIRKADVQGQGEILAVGFSGSDRLLVCDGGKRVLEYSVKDETLQRTYSPRMGIGERLYHWVVLPVYTVAPKPREFYHTTQYLLSGKKSIKRGRRMDDLQEEIHPWRPVWSSAIFIVVMLGIACLYVERQEF